MEEKANVSIQISSILQDVYVKIYIVRSNQYQQFDSLIQLKCSFTFTILINTTNLAELQYVFCICIDLNVPFIL